MLNHHGNKTLLMVTPLLLQMTTTHPYFPRSLALPHYRPNERPTEQLTSTAAVLMGSLILTAWASTRYKTQMKCNDRLRFVWFTVCGILHCGFEAYWLLYHREVAARSDIFSELWKEYAHSDSRYLTADPLLLALETITVCIWGPLCIATGIALWQHSQLQFLFQLMASMGHLFSCTLYFAIDLPTGFLNCNPQAHYFWLYFVSFNAPWLLMPALLVYQSANRIVFALQTRQPPTNLTGSRG